MSRRTITLIAVLFVVRTGISFLFSDGLFRSDSLTYFGAVVNLGLTGSMASIQPEDEPRFARGADGDELYRHLAGIRDPLYRPLGYQWLHSAVYAPILFFWRSLTPVIIINNLLFFGAGIFFFRTRWADAGQAAQYAGWIVFAFFPPFFYMTSQFFSEPLFLFFLGALILLAEKEGSEQFFFLFIAAAALCLTRPFGIMIVLALALFSAVRRRYARAFGLVAAVGLAAGINTVVMLHAYPADARVYAVSAAETFYCTNAAAGNGDYDLYFDVPEAAQSDTTLMAYRSGRISGARLMAEAALQNLRAPGRFVRNSAAKLTNYFFSVVPASWIYPGKVEQTPAKKLLWVVQNLLLYVLIAAGIYRSRSPGTGLFAWLFVVGLLFHFFLLARYRYLLPLLAYASAFIPSALEYVMPNHLKHPSPQS
jgi:hypothetical protein